MSTHKFPYRWRLSDGYPSPGIDYHGSTVFGTFICGGGSTMGYKLAGYHHLGGVEIDPKVASVYRANHAPELLFVEDLRKFNDRTDLPDELYSLDLLDGSPPCTTFSMAGDREDAWGVDKSFSEGGVKQRLDDLVFVYCDTIAKLRPKVCLLENVAGLLRGNAKSYAKRIYGRLNEAGYRVQVFLLSAANMGVPQLRQRTFFIGLRSDLASKLPPLELHFDEPPIPFGEVRDRTDTTRNLSDLMYGLWLARKPSDNEIGDILRRQGGGNKYYTCAILSDERVAPTLTTVDQIVLYDVPRKMNDRERLLCSSFPLDYRAEGSVMRVFITGMCVPPVMAAQISHQIWLQWLSRLR